MKNPEGALERMKFDVEKFVKDNAAEMPSEERMSSKNWSCVDGRIAQAGRFAGPGGALGLEMAVFAAAERLKSEDSGTAAIDGAAIVDVVERELGGMSCHTDTHAEHEGKKLLCAGCGHCSGALEHPEQYGISSYANFLVDHLGELENWGVKPEVLDGNHEEEAVILIAQALPGQPSLTLPGTGKNGEQAFICHLEDFYATAEKLAEKLAHVLGIEAEPLRAATRSAVEDQVRATLKRLAAGKPVYKVSQNKDGTRETELVAPDAAAM